MPPTHDQEPTLEETVATVLKTLPAPIREYVVAKKYEAVVSNLTKKYALHIDQAATLERNVLFLLLGVTTPDEFSESLESEAGIQKEQVYNIIGDLNEQIFVPLQQGVREDKGSSDVPLPPKEARPAEEAPVPLAAAPAPEALSSLPPKSALPRPAAPAPATVAAVAPSRPSVLPPAQTLPAPKPSINKLQGWRSDEKPVPAQAPTPGPAEKPVTFEQTPAPVPMKATPTPGEIISTPPVSRTAPPPPNLPGVVAPSAPIQKPSVPLTKAYAADPYREPIDEA